MTMATAVKWQLSDIDHQLIEIALTEDLGLVFSDITTHTLFKGSQQIATAKIISKHSEPIVICGFVVINRILSIFASDHSMQTQYQDGQWIAPGETIVTFRAEASALLMIERIILNFLQRLSAVATMTAKFVNAVKGTSLKILDTRKTIPGFRHLEKYAVICGGGVNHRTGLYDAILVKDTHIDLLGGIDIALEKLPLKNNDHPPVIIEVRDKDELHRVLEKGRQKISRVLLDNMSPALMKECVALCRGIFATEASGNIDLQNIRAVAESGVDFASVGKLTHSANSVDLSMKI